MRCGWSYSKVAIIGAAGCCTADVKPNSLQGLRSLFGTLIVSLPAFWNVGALLGLLFFMYAYVGMLLLGSVKHNG